MKNIRDILVASDLTTGSDVVVAGAAALAALTGSRLHVLHIYEFHPAPYLQSLPPAAFHDHVSALRDRLVEQLDRTVPPGVQVASKEVAVDAAQRAILSRASQVDADLIVIGRHRPTGIADAFLGGTADNIVRSAQVPVLILHDPFSAPLRRVLVPIDLSEPALHALDVGVQWVGHIGAADSTPEMIVLHVIPRIFDYKDMIFDSSAVAMRLQEAIDQSCARQHAPAGLHPYGVIRWADDTADEIVSFVAQENVDLVVLGTHGYGALGRALLGSVSSGVAREATCPVLLVPPAMAESD